MRKIVIFVILGGPAYIYRKRFKKMHSMHVRPVPLTLHNAMAIVLKENAMSLSSVKTSNLLCAKIEKDTTL